MADLCSVLCGSSVVVTSRRDGCSLIKGTHGIVVAVYVDGGHPCLLLMVDGGALAWVEAVDVRVEALGCNYEFREVDGG